MTAPRLHAPADDGVEIAGSAAVVERALRHHGRGVNAELPPLLRDHGAGAGHHWARLAFDRDAHRERLALGRHPLITGLLETGLLQKLLRRLRIGFPPAAAEGLGDLGGVRRDLLAHAGPQHVRDLFAYARVVRLDLTLAGVEFEALQPALERHVVVVGIGAGRRHADRRDRRGAAI